MNLVRSIGIVVGIIPILLIAPTICAASMDMPPMEHHSGSQQEGTAIPQCVSTSHNPLSHHVLMNAIGEEVTPNRLILEQDICLSCSPADMPAEPSPNEGSPVQRDIDHTPLPNPVEHRCRSYLRSEEPPL